MTKELINKGNLSENDLLSILSSMSGTNFSGGSREIYRVVEAVNLFLDESGESIKAKSVLPSFPPGTIGMMIPQTRYWIFAKRASLSIACAIVDALMTKGLLALAVGPEPLRNTMIKLSDQNGEICVLQSISDWKGQINVDHAVDVTTAHLSQQVCKNPLFRCPHRTNKQCHIGRSDIKGCIEDLLDKEILVTSESADLKINR